MTVRPSVRPSVFTFLQRTALRRESDGRFASETDLVRGKADHRGGREGGGLLLSIRVLSSLAARITCVTACPPPFSPYLVVFRSDSEQTLMTMMTAFLDTIRDRKSKWKFVVLLFYQLYERARCFSLFGPSGHTYVQPVKPCRAESNGPLTARRGTFGLGLER